MKLSLYYANTKLGDLEKTENGYIYSSNISNEEELKINGVITNSEYSLWYSSKREEKTLFPEFERILEKCSKREDILQLAEIDPNDSEWEQLVKLSGLNWFQSSLCLRQSD